MTLLVAYGTSSTSGSRMMLAVSLKDPNASGAVTSARSNSSGWLHTLRNCMMRFIRRLTLSSSLSDEARDTRSVMLMFSRRVRYMPFWRGVRSQ